MKYRVPVRVSVAPVQTYKRTVVVEAASRAEAARKASAQITDLIDTPGWKPVGGRLDAIRPDLTAYHTYLDEQSLDDWVSGIVE
jgi:hypothetical protein